MTKTSFFHKIVFILVFIACSHASYAIGIGPYFTGDVSTYSFTIKEKPVYEYYQSSYTKINSIQNLYYGLGIGFIIDTNVAQDKLFNFRVKFGFSNKLEKEEAKNRPFNVRYGLNHYYLKNIFGLSFFRNQYVRLWCGPQLSVTYQYIKHSLNPDKRYIDYLDYEIYRRFNIWFLSIGAVAGINIHFKRYITVCFDIGFSGGYGIPDLSKNYYATEIETFVTFSVLYRINDDYVSPPEQQ
ncbi:MAG: hypothetical protein A2176_00140 [Spirochaetes bacterium RBG_13_51_14]|nr:MAG: hypothetical protein A2176_00140 [Spirochaetes bacterium RBG_13_51_14]